MPGNFSFDALRLQALLELQQAEDQASLENWRVLYLGKKSKLTELLRTLGSLPPEERRTAGAQTNELKNLLETTFNERKTAMADAIVASAARHAAIDVSLPGQPAVLGRLHPITQVTREVCAIFASLGFQVAEGPDIETEYYNFEALNIPADHPARDSFSTFFISPDCGTGVKCLDAKGRQYLLRTHTSPVQVRTMEKSRPPIRIVAPGTVYRYEATDATHEFNFHQIEGLAVDKGISFADLKGTLTDFLRIYFGQERKVRFRCDFFPFVEPGAEVAIDCFACKGTGCRLCGQSGWIEILGAGMVHPNVLRGMGINPEVYSGFAFGVGLDRLHILRDGVDDIRLYAGNDLRFLRQF